ncbi:MAG: zinc-ribbon domain-containing protein [Pyrinomonadaceae bacterium]
MTIVCPKCSSRLQVNEKKAPTRPFTVRCPKCKTSVEAASPTASVEQSAVGVGGSPSTGNTRFEQATPAPLFEFDQKKDVAEKSATETLAELLSGLLNQPRTMTQKSPNARPSWDPRKALVCVTEDIRDSMARGLAETGYQVFVAQDTTQAVERMREQQLEVVLLDSRFDAVEQGSVFVTREVNILRPSQRRRLFFVLISPSLRTMDAHTAFLNNANAIINVNDVQDLPRLLENQLRSFNELYKDLNNVTGVPAL